MNMLFRSLFVLILFLLPCVGYGQYFPDTAWTRCYGGSDWEDGLSIQQTYDGGYIVLGKARSTDGDLVNAPPGNKAWVLKIDSVGNIEWQRHIPALRYPKNICQTIDSGYIFGGDQFIKLTTTGAIDLQLNMSCNLVLATFDGGFATLEDFKIKKWSTAGTLEWDNAPGSPPVCFTQAQDGGFMIGVHYDEEQGPDFHECVRVSNTGSNLYWKDVSSGSYNSKRAVKSTLDSSFIWIGTGNNYTDSWGYLVKRDSSAQWYKQKPGKTPYDVVQNIDSTFLFCGFDTLGNAIVTKTSSSGDDLVTVSFGGSGYDNFQAISKTRDSGYVAVGTTHSSDGDVWGYHGAGDLRIVKFKPDTSVHVPVSVKERVIAKSEIVVYPNPSNGVVNVRLPEAKDASFIVTNIVGQDVPIAVTGSGNERRIRIAGQPAGQYILQVRMGSERKSFRITLNQ